MVSGEAGDGSAPRPGPSPPFSTFVIPSDVAHIVSDYPRWGDQKPSCPARGRPSHFMAPTGEGTPFRPLITPSGRHVLGVRGATARRDFTATELMAFTPRDVEAAGIDLSVFCAACRVLRPVALDRLAAARAVQPVSAMKFRYGKCRRPGSAMLTWRDDNNDYRSFDFSKA